ncbi:MscS family membrane protein [Salsuginibacillus halophilus]|uniref:MscS family membrane protein n=1 Tax=Salsuginibacillus halophilus TaxID=517424 RepID=A0A2P8HX99_9BACI|nr:mechanosensitive ion channel family protein [Salsuginibacillus halophilus]PSL50873.1 MscS family membrane protein [Salsuginibacillus halophilus]
MNLTDWESWLEIASRADWQQYLIALLIFILLYLFRKIFTKYLFSFILRLSRKGRTNFMPNLLLSFEKPFHFLLSILGFYLALLYLPLPSAVNVYIHTLFRSFVLVALGWGLYNFSAASSAIFRSFIRKVDQHEDSMVVPFLSRLLRFIIIALTVTVIAQEWGYEITGFVAGLGLGGLAFALAAQDTLSNFFGGVVIVTERPFKRGDWVETPSVEGIVEDISFRSTSIRTFQDSLMIVPNSTLANEAITNWSEMDKRRVMVTLGLTYTTPPDKVERCVERFREYLKHDDEIDQEELEVHFHEFNAYSLDVLIYFFTKTTAWSEWLQVRERVHLDFMRILAEEEVSIAFPTQSIYMEATPEATHGKGVRQEEAEE